MLTEGVILKYFSGSDGAIVAGPCEIKNRQTAKISLSVKSNFPRTLMLKDDMHSTVEILNKTVRVEWSVAAEAAMARQVDPLTVEMELYFSCLIRKKVRFGSQAHSREFILET